VIVVVVVTVAVAATGAVVMMPGMPSSSAVRALPALG
jgi:hypothetical protein